MSELVTRTLEIYAAFDQEVQQLLARESFWQPCTQCVDGYCCRTESVPVMQHEWERLVRCVKTTIPENQKRPGRLSFPDVSALLRLCRTRLDLPYISLYHF